MKLRVIFLFNLVQLGAVTSNEFKKPIIAKFFGLGLYKPKKNKD